MVTPISCGVVPNTWLTSRCELYETSEATALSGTIASASGKLCSMRRKSANDSPYFTTIDICPDAKVLDWAGLAERTMMLEAPSAWMLRRAACLLPSPIETIKITAATPRMMPSDVSSDRSLCSRRLLSPSRMISSRKVMTSVVERVNG